MRSEFEEPHAATRGVPSYHAIVLRIRHDILWLYGQEKTKCVVSIGWKGCSASTISEPWNSPLKLYFKDNGVRVSVDQKRIKIAVHEIGHAVMALFRGEGVQESNPNWREQFPEVEYRRLQRQEMPTSD